MEFLCLGNQGVTVRLEQPGKGEPLLAVRQAGAARILLNSP
jgi:hypothetical protein